MSCNDCKQRPFETSCDICNELICDDCDHSEYKDYEYRNNGYDGYDLGPSYEKSPQCRNCYANTMKIYHYSSYLVS